MAFRLLDMDFSGFNWLHIQYRDVSWQLHEATPAYRSLTPNQYLHRNDTTVSGMTVTCLVPLPLFPSHASLYAKLWHDHRLILLTPFIILQDVLGIWVTKAQRYLTRFPAAVRTLLTYSRISYRPISPHSQITWSFQACSLDLCVLRQTRTTTTNTLINQQTRNKGRGNVDKTREQRAFIRRVLMSFAESHLKQVLFAGVNLSRIHFKVNF